MSNYNIRCRNFYDPLREEDPIYENESDERDFDPARLDDCYVTKRKKIRKKP